jgi:hypothetical protein
VGPTVGLGAVEKSLSITGIEPGPTELSPTTDDSQQIAKNVNIICENSVFTGEQKKLEPTF